MENYSLAHLSDDTLDRELVTSSLQEVEKTAVVLARIAESEARRRYAFAGYPSMVTYCMVRIPQLCESKAAALNRIHAARTAREYPVIFSMVADGRLSLTAVNLLTPYLTVANVEELLVAAAGKTVVEVQTLLATHFPKPDLPTVFQPLPATLSGNRSFQNESGHMAAPVIPPAPVPPPRVMQLSAERVGVQMTIARSTDEKLHRIRAMRPGDLEQTIDWMCDLALRHLEKRKFAATDKPRACRKRKTDSRHIPAEVRRAVRERDGERCTYVSPDGHHCEARAHLQFDHIVPFAHGGEATAGNIRIRCRTHNQFAAEQTFGVAFMEAKREQTRAATAEKRRAPEMNPTSASDPDHDVTPWLRSLGIRPADAKRAEAHCASMSNATLEERVKAALAFLAPPHRKIRCA